VITNILVAGIGGQGVMTAAELLARAALTAGLTATKTEFAGMSQRGGSVCSHVRVGASVRASAIRPGSAQLLLALESAEALRYRTYLAADAMAFVSTLRAVPPVVSSGASTYPEAAAERLRESGVCVIEVDAPGIARSLGDVRLANSVILGAASSALPIEARILQAEILARFARNSRLAELNAAAFASGQELALLMPA
jgi:indolepyruvate ferredoxin oxidoreductase, beta subunit